MSALDELGPGSRVVYACLDPGVPAFGGKGCSVHVQEVLRVLAATGAQVHLLTTRTGGPPPAGLEQVHVHHLPLPAGRTGAEREQDQRALDERAGHLVSALLRGAARALVYERYALFAHAVQESARALGVPSVLEVNAPLPLEQARHRTLHDAAGADASTRRALRAATRVVAVSSPVAQWVHHVLRQPGAERAGAELDVDVDVEVDVEVDVAVVPNGVDVHRFRPAARPLPGEPLPDERLPGEPLPDSADDSAGGGRGGTFTLAFVGAFRPWHGVDLLVEAAGRLAALPGRPVRLLLIGDGPQRGAVLRRAAELDVAVEAPGALEPAAVPAALAGADAAVAPYPAGAAYFSPLKVAEYLACALPTVAAAVGDLPDCYGDGQELLLTAPGDVDALTGALQRLRTDAALRTRLGAAGRAAVEQRRSWRRTVELSLPAAPAERRSA
ncbi:glycosyltransferase family 4 protein [Kineococcus sp. SYSU DK006]|uniref:glycosyltransferase family 4 protein n=1 Tax=Kineococcus sp. SYSU DK006 TaxID=3383127 RepID=UPI003D7C740E